MGFLKSSVHVNKIAIGNLDFNLMSTKNKFATLATSIILISAEGKQL